MPVIRLSSYLTNTALPAGPNRASRSCCLLVVPPCVCVNVSLRARSCERPTVCDIEFRICDSSMTVTSGPLREYAASGAYSIHALARSHACSDAHAGGAFTHPTNTRRRVCPYTVCGFCVFAPLSRSAKPKTPKAVPVAHDQTPVERDGGVTERVECVCNLRYCFVPTHAADASTPARATLIVIRRIMEG